MDPAGTGAAGCLEKEQLTEMLEKLSDDELAQMARRLAKSREGFEQALTDLEAEKVDLKEENMHLHGTIQLIMDDLKKVNIGADNIPEPELNEGPVEFIGRIWEKMKPRDTAVYVDEHVGEIRKPVPAGEEGSSPQMTAQRLREQLVDRISILLPASSSNGVDGEQDESHGDLGRQFEERRQELGKQVADRFSELYSSIEEAASSAMQDSSLPDAEEISRQRQELGEKITKQKQDFEEMVTRRQEEASNVRDQLVKQGQEFGENLGKRLTVTQESISEKFSKQREEFGEMFSRVQEGGLPQVGEELSKHSQEVRKSFMSLFSTERDREDNFTAEREHTPTWFQPAERTPSISSFFNYFGSPGTQKQELGPDSAGPGADEARPRAPGAAAPASGSSSTTSAGSSAASDSEPGSKATSNGTTSEGSDELTPTVAGSDSARAAADAAAAPPRTPAPAPAPAEKPAAEPPQQQSTLLIEVELTMDDGGVQVLQMRAADRVKEVVSRFIREHSLKAWFEAPLKAYLQEQEANATKFPVMLKADLMEIRRQYSSNKNV